MNISILTVGSRGDVQPFLALAIGLKEAGYNVKFGANIEFKDFIEKRGIEFDAIRDNPMDALKEENRKASSKEKRQLYYKFMTNWTLDGLKAAKNADLIIFTPVYHVGYHVAEKLNIPCIKCSYSPYTPTKEFPNPFLGSFPKPLHKLSYTVYSTIEWMTIKNFTNRLRKEVLGLKPIPFPGMLSRLNKQKIPIIYGFSDKVVPRPNDWPEWIHVAGYWFLNDLEQYSPYGELDEFLNSGEEPIYFDIGSLGFYSRDIVKQIIQALAKTKYRVIANPGKSDVIDQIKSDKILFVDGSVPHAWILPKVKAVISHGGPSTVASVLKAGKPLSIVPIYGDHKFWGKRVFELGVGTRPIPIPKLNEKLIIDTAEELMTNKSLGEKAEALGEKIRKENGVRNAVKIIEDYMSKTQ